MHTFETVTVLVICFGLSRAIVWSNQDKKAVTVDVKLTRTGRSLRSVEEQHHDVIHLGFEVDNSKLAFELRRNDRLFKPSHVHILNGGKLEVRHVPDMEEMVYYQDHKHVAAFAVQGDNMYGIFSINGRGYHMTLPDNSSREDGYYSANVIQMENSQQGTGFIDNYESSINSVKNNHPRRVKRATGQHQIELLMVCDYSVYKYWYDKSTKTTPSEKETEVLASVKQYYAFMINGMDTMYKNIQTTQYTMSIVYAGIIIAKTPSDAPWTENNKNFGSPRYRVDSGAGLSAFGTWVKGNSNLPGNDHAMLFTKYDLTSQGSSVNAGLANLGRMCTPDSVSIVEENFDFVCITTAAHELGHGLSAEHDGLGNGCSQASAYIMAAVSSPQQSVATASNPWRFSVCSTNYFTTLINNLDASNNNCMKTLSPGYNPNGQAPYNQNLPGQLYTADQQCKEIHGQTSYLCREQYNGDFSTICSILWCRDPSTASSCTSSVAGSGTHCGNRKWCISGQCVTDFRAPGGVENCLYGDKVGIIFSNTGWTCADMYAASPAYCAQTGILCCGTCNPTTPAPSTTSTTTSATTTPTTTTTKTTTKSATSASTVTLAPGITSTVSGSTTPTSPAITTPAGDNTVSKFKVIVVMVGAVVFLIALIGGILFCLCCRKKKKQTKKRKETIRKSKQLGYSNAAFSDIKPTLGSVKELPIEIDDGPRVYTIPKNMSIRSSGNFGSIKPPPYQVGNSIPNGNPYPNSFRY